MHSAGPLPIRRPVTTSPVGTPVVFEGPIGLGSSVVLSEPPRQRTTPGAGRSGLFADSVDGTSGTPDGTVGDERGDGHGLVLQVSFRCLIVRLRVCARLARWLRAAPLLLIRSDGVGK